MARNHNGQMALYEVLNKERFNTAQKKELSRVSQVKSEKVMPVTIPPQPAAGGKGAEAKQTVWNKKPSMFGLGGGRIETYVPYPIAVTIVMALALVLIIVFQVGHFMGKRDTDIAKTTEKSSEVAINLAETAKAAKEMARLAAPITKRTKASEAVMPAATTTTVGSERTESAKAGENVIVLKELSSSRDLEPAKKFFDEHGIATEIKNFKGSYLLVTKEKYDSLSPGTPGYAASEKIKRIGANYKPPEGYNGFAPHNFDDVYGRKM